MRLITIVLAVLGAVAALPAPTATQAIPDWSQWRGPNRDGHSAETGLLPQWPAGGPPRVWQASGAGEGFSSFSTAQGRLFTLGARGNTEYLIALEAATGARVWETPLGARFNNGQGDGPRGTPTVDGARLYAIGGGGDLAAFELASGRKLWSVNLASTFGASVPYWGYSESPLVVGDRLVVNAGGRRASIVAIDKATGRTVWQNHGDEAGYSSPVMLSTGSLQQVVFFTGQRALAVDPRDGRLLWSYDRASNRTANIATPVVRGNRVFFSSDYGTGGGLVAVKAAGAIAAAEEVYFTRDMRNHHSSSVLVDGTLYGFSSSVLTAIDFDSGRLAWRDRSVGKGSLIYADGRLYLYSERGTVGLAEATPGAYVERGRFSLPTGNAPTWSHPIITQGRLILRDQDTVYAFDIRR